MNIKITSYNAICGILKDNLYNVMKIIEREKLYNRTVNDNLKIQLVGVISTLLDVEGARISKKEEKGNILEWVNEYTDYSIAYLYKLMSVSKFIYFDTYEGKYKSYLSNEDNTNNITVVNMIHLNKYPLDVIKWLYDDNYINGDMTKDELIENVNKHYEKYIKLKGRI